MAVELLSDYSGGGRFARVRLSPTADAGPALPPSELLAALRRAVAPDPHGGRGADSERPSRAHLAGWPHACALVGVLRASTGPLPAGPPSHGGSGSGQRKGSLRHAPASAAPGRSSAGSVKGSRSARAAAAAPPPQRGGRGAEKGGGGGGDMWIPEGGARVRVMSLRGSAARYSGQTGTVARVEEEKGGMRAIVDLDGGGGRVRLRLSYLEPEHVAL